MDENIIKINLVETADRLATIYLVTKYEAEEDIELMEESKDEPGVFIWKEHFQDEYNHSRQRPPGRAFRAGPPF